MSGPFIVKTTSTIHPGKANAYTPLAREICELVQEKEPRVLGFHIYTNDDQSSEVVIQIHPDAESMQYHINLVREKVRETFGYTDFESLEIYGAVSDELGKWIERVSEGVPVSLYPVHLGGFTRLNGL